MGLLNDLTFEERRRLSGCLTKRPYFSWSSATRAARALRRKHGVMQVYKCEFCNLHHLGH